VPVDPASGELASTTDDRTWTDLETAQQYAAERTDVAGLGFVFTAVDSLVGVDLDDCRDPETGELDEQASAIVERLDSYTEVSPPGTGVHVIVEGTLPADRRRSGDVEMYEEARCFTMTGAHLSLTPQRIHERAEALSEVHADVIADRTGTDPDSPTAKTVGASPPESLGNSTERSISDESAPETGDSASDSGGGTLDDEALLHHAREAANGEKFERLWQGQTAGYPSHSEADMALCCLLAFWTSGDQTQMEQLFRQSGLHREKWDEVHYADGSTYGEKTIERAIATTSEFYDPDAGEESTHASSSTGEATADACDASERSRAYLTEKNRLLSERVNELEATLEQKTDWINTLEAKIERLTDELAARGRETEQPQDEQAATANESDDGSATRSVWGRLFGGRSE